MTKRTWPPVVSPPAQPFRMPARPSAAPRPAHAEAEVLLENEERRLERALARMTSELNDIERQIDLKTPRNRRYNVNFTFDWVDEPAPTEPLYVDTRSAVVNKDRRFYAMGMEVHYKLQSAGATFALGPVFMREFFDFEWRIKDTGSDREWSNDWLPSDFLYSGDMCGLLTPSAPAVVGGNASIDVSVRVIKSDNSGEGTLFASIERHLLQVSFIGVEVPE